MQQAVQVGAPLPPHVPAAHKVHVAIDVAPIAALEVPVIQDLHVAIDVAPIVLL